MIDPLANVPGSDDPLALLRACHDRIRGQLGLLEQLCRRLPEFGCDDESRRAARKLLKYFDTAAPNHDADEEQSLFPRLASAARAEASALLERLAVEHQELKTIWRLLRPDIAAIEAGKRSVLTPDSVRRIRQAYLKHLDGEEADLLPLAAARLDDATLREIGAEMTARRAALPRQR